MDIISLRLRSSEFHGNRSSTRPQFLSRPRKLPQNGLEYKYPISQVNSLTRLPPPRIVYHVHSLLCRSRIRSQGNYKRHEHPRLSRIPLLQRSKVSRPTHP